MARFSLIFLFLTCFSALANSSTISCGKSGDSFASCTYAAASGVNDGDILFQTTSFSTAVTAVISKCITLTAATGAIWNYTSVSNAFTLSSSAMAPGHFYIDKMNIVTQDPAAIFSILTPLNQEWANDFYFTGCSLYIMTAAGTHAAVAISGVSIGTNTPLSVTVKSCDIRRFNQGVTGIVIKGPTGGTGPNYWLIENSFVYNASTNTAAGNSCFSYNAIAGNPYRVFISRNNTWVNSSNNSEGIINLGNGIFGGTYSELINNAFWAFGTNSTDARALTVSTSTLIKNNAFFFGDIYGGSNNFQVTSSMFANITSLNFKPISGYSQLAYRGLDMSSLYTRDIIGAPWAIPFGVGAYFKPANLQQASPNNISRAR